MTKFKVGDMVRVIDAYNPAGAFKGLPAGTVTTVERISGGLAYLRGVEKYFYPDSAIELAASPIRTVTRREIVPGDYDAVIIEDGIASASVDIDGADAALILREAARIFNEIADVLEENAA